MVYCRDRSMKLPRKAKRKPVINNTARIAPYRANDHRDKPSQLEQRCETGVWLTAKEVEALKWLDMF